MLWNGIDRGRASAKWFVPSEVRPKKFGAVLPIVESISDVVAFASNAAIVQEFDQTLAVTVDVRKIIDNTKWLTSDRLSCRENAMRGGGGRRHCVPGSTVDREPILSALGAGASGDGVVRQAATSQEEVVWRFESSGHMKACARRGQGTSSAAADDEDWRRATVVATSRWKEAGTRVESD